MEKADARKEEYELVELFGKPALFTNERISRFTVPQGWFCYDLRGKDKGYRTDNCVSRSEYIEKAVRFYTGYLRTQEAGAYMPRILADVLESKLVLFGERIDKLLFKLLVQDAIMANLIAADTDVDLQTLESLTGTCVKQVARIHGVLGFKEALKFQKELT